MKITRYETLFQKSWTFIHGQGEKMKIKTSYYHLSEV